MNVVVFDGVCNICNGWVQFILKRDSSANIHFASAQSAFGAALLRKNGFSEIDPETMLFQRNGTCFEKSDAVIQILDEIGGGWAFASILNVIPKTIRDSVYTLVARNRYKIGGKLETCPIPTEDVLGRFLS